MNCPGTRPTASMWQAAIVAANMEGPALPKLIRKNESVLIRLPWSGDVVTCLASTSYDTSVRSSIRAAETSGRKQAQGYLKILRALPGHENMYPVSTGPNFETRESRHINGVYQLSQDDILSGSQFEDNIALGAWGFEFHDEHNQNSESTFKIAQKLPLQIPLRSLRSINTGNLFAASWYVDGGQYAGGAVRVKGTALATGKATAKSREEWSFVDVVRTKFLEAFLCSPRTFSIA